MGDVRGAANEHELVAFFKGRGTDVECRTLDQILAWEDVLMELCHDYVQWLFPTDQPSRFNRDAPILDEELQAVFRADEGVRANLRRALARFLAFLGLRLELRADSCAGEAPASVEVVRAANFDSRLVMCWSGPENHNWKRISRVLRCLGLAGLWQEQAALSACLDQIVSDLPGLVDGKAVEVWREQMAVGVQRGGG